MTDDKRSASQPEIPGTPEGTAAARKVADEVDDAIRKVEQQARNQLIEKAVLDTANDIVRGVVNKNAEKINENAMIAMREIIREEFEKMGIIRIIHEEAHKFIKDYTDANGVPFLKALDEIKMEPGEK